MKIYLFLTIVICLSFPLLYAQSICIDPGHGGSDPGAVGCGLKEAHINLDVSLRFYNLMKNAGHPTYITRNSDATVSLSSRATYANNVGVDRFVSVHCNAFNGSANGTETYCYGNGGNLSFSMRNQTNPQIVSALGTYNRGCKTADFYVLKYTDMPAILAELAFIDNAGDAAKLGDAYYRQKAAEALKRGQDNSREAVNVELTSVDFTQEPKVNSYIAPRWSPDGTTLLVSKPGYYGLYTVSAVGGKVKPIIHAPHVGYHAKWASSHEIRYGKLHTEKNLVNLEGIQTRDSSAQNKFVWSEENEIWFALDGEKKQITHGEDMFYNPVLSPDSKWIVYEGLSTGLYVYNVANQQHTKLGAGNHPSWTPDSQSILFDVSQDNGHEILGSQIYMVTLQDSKWTDHVNLTRDIVQKAQNPSVSPDGKKVAFDAEGKIFIFNFGQKNAFTQIKIEE